MTNNHNKIYNYHKAIANNRYNIYVYNIPMRMFYDILELWTLFTVIQSITQGILLVLQVIHLTPNICRNKFRLKIITHR